ncbi:Nucleolar MIF4G domain-containing protein 1 [Trichoplax sp. H2]|nr:Nucleolar MIF4G domain-containing protein 1 [Trichoplax sp. H2]|eukprot:RDD36878.1 Nucleolar MIF4G domain-containing protein 1 [Trichoplax sp. H2]
MGKAKTARGEEKDFDAIKSVSSTISRKERRKQSRLAKKQNRRAYYSKMTTNSTEAKHPKSSQEPTSDNRKKSLSSKKKRKRNQVQDEDNQSFNNSKINLSMANKVDDKVISKLEWKLKLNKKNPLPSAFRSDGLDYLLEACDRIDSNTNVDKVITRKKQKTKSISKRQSDNSSDDNDSCESDDEVLNEADEDNFVSQDLSSEGENVNLDSDNSDCINDEESLEEDSEVDLENKSNSTADECASNDGDSHTESVNNESNELRKDLLTTKTEKYIPPQQRMRNENDSKEIDAIRKQMKGYINRLSESNIGIIINQIENLYRNYSRFGVTETLTQLIFDSCIQNTLIPEKLIMEHVVVITVLHSNVGTEIGAHFIEKLALFYKNLYNEIGPIGTNKRCHNALSLFCHLYNFKVIHCTLIYDLIRKSIESMNQLDVELLLHILRNVGLQIRNDDPTALKEIASQIHSKSGSLVCTVDDASRINFMLDTLKYVCNNNSKKLALFDPTLLENLKVICRRLSKERQGDAQMQISLKDLLACNKTGRWWVIGSSWSDRETFGRQDKELSGSGIGDNRLVELAKKQRMNTDIRRNIFCIIMSSQDYVNAFENLLKLKLKNKQERDIIHVLLDCCLQEKSFNPFYAYLGQKFCEYKRNYQITFQYSIWDRLKRLEDLSKIQRLTFSKLLANLFLSNSLSLSALKIVNFGELNETSIKFYRSLLLQLLLDKSEKSCRSIFGRVGNLSHLSDLREGLLIFLKHYVLRHLEKSKATKVDIEMLRRRIELVELELKIIK